MKSDKVFKTSIVVANHGRDLSILKNSLPEGVEFIEVNLGFERSKQRNIGISQAKGDIIIWLDSDQSLSPYLVEEVEAMISYGYVALYIPEVIVAKSFFGKIRKFEREFYTGTPIDVPRAIRKDRFPLFDETLNGPEDADMGQRIRGLKGTTTRCLYHHDDVSFKEYCFKKSYYSKSMKRYAEKWPNDKCLNLNYRCFDVFFEKGKWKKLLQHPILSVGIFVVVFVRGIIYLKNK